MSQSDRDADLSGAIKQLEALLDAQPDNDGSEQLPVLDDVIEPGTEEAGEAFEQQIATPSFTGTTRPDPEQIRALLDRIAEQMEAELESVVGMLKHNMLKEFRNELATALNIDPQQLDTYTDRQDDQKQ